MIRLRSTLLMMLGWLGVLSPTPAGPADTVSPADRDFFERKVRPLLIDKCWKCHSTQTKKQRGGLLLDSRPALLKGGDTGPALVPGQPDKSLLVHAVRHANDELKMPPDGKLPPERIAVLEEWVRRGAPFPGEAPTVGVNLAEGRKFWSFQPLREASLPLPAGVPSRNRLDAFILAELLKQGLSPAPQAAKETLLRRLTFDLTGLPPTPEAVEEFQTDERTDAYERVVERLLASPAYGERWARFWLDLVRYCDVAEPWLESKGSPYLYRDWVVRAFNTDLPYDQFVQRQLAADLLPGANPEDRAALGFLGLSPSYWKELKLDRDVIRGVVADEWEERIHTLSSTVLGLTVACARCHDHKFDPIPQTDYYALAGVLASIRQADRSVLPDAAAAVVEKARARVREMDEQIKKRTAKKPLSAEDEKAVGELRAQQASLRKTPGFEGSLVPGVEESSLFVEADGPARTKLIYKPGLGQDVAMQKRGNPATLGPVVPRRFLSVLSPPEPRTFTHGSGRAELADALFHEGGALAARVMVNRVWEHHFGTGLVATPSDFGAQGMRPTHPELLDDLAFRFRASGWSLKWLHREIVLSSTYRQSSVVKGDRLRNADPDNRLLGRMSRRRLEVEAWRDSMLAVSGQLSREVGGPARDLSDTGNVRRTLYGVVKRRELNDLLRLHDFPDPTGHSPTRVPSTSPLQQLFVLNSPFLQGQAAGLAARLRAEVPAGGAGRIERAYRLLFGRAPTSHERELALGFLAEEGGSETAWESYARVLLGSNEFLFVD
jgi:hypothetical protein